VAILDLFKSEHQKRVDQFMKLAKQDLPEKPTEPSKAVRHWIFPGGSDLPSVGNAVSTSLKMKESQSCGNS
jgi:hypothetical protein